MNGGRSAERKSDDCARQSAPNQLWAGVSDSKSKGYGEAHRPLTRARFILHSVSASGDYDDYSVPSGVAVPVSGSGGGFGVMPGAAVRSLRLPVAYIPIRTADTCHPRQHGFPTGCLAGPGSGERQRGQRGPSEGPGCGTLCALHP